MEVGPARSPRAAADSLVQKMRETTEFIQASMAEAQQQQEKYWNQNRQQAWQYKVGDKVWLSLENVKTKRPKKGLDHRFRKFTVVEALGSHNYRLDTPPGLYDVFHSKLLRPAASSPLPGQILHEPQDPGIDVDGEIEYEVEKIMDEKRGRGGAMRYLVKWVGYTEPTWEPFSFVQELRAFDDWERAGEREGSGVRG